MNSFRKKLIEIENSQSYEELNNLLEASQLAVMPSEDVELFARLLVLHGAQQLAKGDQKVLETFDLAIRISGHSSKVLLQQGLIFASYPDNIRCLILAHTVLIRAIETDPTCFEAWFEEAKVLLGIGLFEHDIHYVAKSHKHFEQAYSLLGQDETIRGTFFWKWGQCLAVLGQLAGEPHDYYKALEKFKLADEAGLHNGSFFNDYGNALAEVGNLLDNREYFVQALKFFNHSVHENPETFDGWFNRACCLQKLCEGNVVEDFLIQANESFSRAAQIDANNSQVWLKWAQLETLLGKFKSEYSIIENALKKFERANELETNQPDLLYFWAEVELLLGLQQERLDLILSAKNKILKSLEIQPDLADTWYLYGICLNELGHYFEEESYYFQAIEKFQYGLSINSRSPLLWYGLALSHYALGEKKNQQSFVEKAVRFCSRVIDCGGGTVPQFWNDWGVALLKLAELTEDPQFVLWAIEKFEKALKHPSINLDNETADLEWIYHYGCAYDLLGDLTGEPQYFEKAVKILSQVVQMDPQDIHARYSYALALYHLAETQSEIDIYQQSLEQFRVLLDEDPEDAMVHIDFAITLISFALLIREEHQPQREHELYRDAELHLIHGASLGSYQAYYYLAGLYSITGLHTQAMHFLEKAQFFGGLPSIVDLLHDEWLDDLRQTSAFREFLDGLSSQSKDVDGR